MTNLTTTTTKTTTTATTNATPPTKKKAKTKIKKEVRFNDDVEIHIVERIHKEMIANLFYLVDDIDDLEADYIQEEIFSMQEDSMYKEKIALAVDRWAANAVDDRWNSSSDTLTMSNASLPNNNHNLPTTYKQLFPQSTNPAPPRMPIKTQDQLQSAAQAPPTMPRRISTDSVSLTRGVTNIESNSTASNNTEEGESEEALLAQCSIPKKPQRQITLDNDPAFSHHKAGDAPPAAPLNSSSTFLPMIPRRQSTLEDSDMSENTLTTNFSEYGDDDLLSSLHSYNNNMGLSYSSTHTIEVPINVISDSIPTRRRAIEGPEIKFLKKQMEQRASLLYEDDYSDDDEMTGRSFHSRDYLGSMDSNQLYDYFDESSFDHSERSFGISERSSGMSERSSGSFGVEELLMAADNENSTNNRNSKRNSSNDSIGELPPPLIPMGSMRHTKKNQSSSSSNSQKDRPRRRRSIEVPASMFQKPVASASGTGKAHHTIPKGSTGANNSRKSYQSRLDKIAEEALRASNTSLDASFLISMELKKDEGIRNLSIEESENEDEDDESESATAKVRELEQQQQPSVAFGSIPTKRDSGVSVHSVTFHNETDHTIQNVYINKHDYDDETETDTFHDGTDHNLHHISPKEYKDEDESDYETFHNETDHHIQNMHFIDNKNQDEIETDTFHDTTDHNIQNMYIKESEHEDETETETETGGVEIQQRSVSSAFSNEGISFHDESYHAQTNKEKAVPAPDNNNNKKSVNISIDDDEDTIKAENSKSEDCTDSDIDSDNDNEKTTKKNNLNINNVRYSPRIKAKTGAPINLLSPYFLETLNNLLSSHNDKNHVRNSFCTRPIALRIQTDALERMLQRKRQQLQRQEEHEQKGKKEEEIITKGEQFVDIQPID